MGKIQRVINFVCALGQSMGVNFLGASKPEVNKDFPLKRDAGITPEPAKKYPKKRCKSDAYRPKGSRKGKNKK